MNRNRIYVVVAVSMTVLAVIISSALVFYFSRTEKCETVPPETSVPIGSSTSEFTVPFPSPTGTLALRDIALKRIQRLSPEAGQDTVVIRSCTKLGCHPAHPVMVSSDEMIVVFDIIFRSHTASETDTASQTAILDGRYARINIDGKSYPIKELTHLEEKWIEQPPQINAPPLMTITQTVWARIPKTATNTEFQFASWKKIQQGPTEQYYSIVHDENVPILRASLGF